MRRTTLWLAALVAVLLVAGCGGKSSSSSGSGGGVPGTASLVPSNAPVYVYANTDFSGDQWHTLNDLLSKFPDRNLAIAALQQQLSDQGLSWDDIKAAFGPDTGLGVLSFTGSVDALLANKANDQAKLDALIAKMQASGGSTTPTQKREIDGYTVVGSSAKALASAEAASKGTSLADSDALKSAFASLPDDALVKVFVEGHSLANAIQAQGGAAAGAASQFASLGSIAASLGVTDDGVHMQAVTKGGNVAAKTFKPTLVDKIPAGVLAYVGFADIGTQLDKVAANPQVSQAFTQIQTAFGVTKAELVSLLSGEGALYVRSGSPLPEVTLVVADDAAAAVATLDKLTAKAAPQLGTTVSPVTVGGVEARKMTVRGIPIYYANVDGKLVITNSTAGITDLGASGDKLSDDSVYTEAIDAAGVPEETTGIVYVNIKDTVPLIDSFASIAGQSLPPQATENLQHLRSFVAYGTASGDTNTFKAFLEIQ